MAEHSGFFDGDKLWGQEELARYFENIYENGISLIDNSNMSFPITSINNTISVEKGFCIIKGYYLYNDTAKSFTINKDSNYNRIDRIVLRLNLSSKAVTIEHKQGTPGSAPIVPDLTRNNIIYELSLCQINVYKNGSISIVDERANKNVCGALRPKNLTEFNSLIASFADRFDRWFENQQGKGWRSIYIQNSQPSGAVEGSIWIK